MMSDLATLDELLDRWEQLAEQGQTPLPADLCTDHPELLAEFTSRVSALQAINRIIAATQQTVVMRGQDPAASPQQTRFPILTGYEVLSEIRRGGMAVVYKAWQLRLDRLVAVKLIRTNLDDDSLRRFRDEARTVAQLRHPGIVQVFDIGESDGNLFFAMEYMEGGSLSQVVRQGTVAAARAAEWIRDAALAVQAAHDHQLIHRDIKSANILLDGDGKIKVADFGLAKDLVCNPGLTRTGQIFGTPGYMAPEQAAGMNRLVSKPADVYGLGATLYELLTGKTPFSVDDDIRKVLEVDPTPPSTLNSSIPRSLQAICLRCLAKKPEDRYASAGTLADDLNRFLRGEKVRAHTRGKLFQSVRRHWTIWVAGILTLVLGAVALSSIGPSTISSQNDSALNRIMDELAARRPVELIGAQGEPRWFAWRGGKGSLLEAKPGDGFSFHCFRMNLLMLIPDPQTESFAFKAQIRLDEITDAASEAGVFFGWKGIDTPKGPHLSCWTVTFNDVNGPQSHIVYPDGSSGNPLSLRTLFRPWQHQGETKFDVTAGGEILLFPPRPAKLMEIPWHDLKVEVNPKRIAITLDNLPVRQVDTQQHLGLAKKVFLREHPGANAAELDTILRGGIGLCIHNAAASFRHVWLIPD